MKVGPPPERRLFEDFLERLARLGLRLTPGGGLDRESDPLYRAHEVAIDDEHHRSSSCWWRRWVSAYSRARRRSSARPSARRQSTGRASTSGRRCRISGGARPCGGSGGDAVSALSRREVRRGLVRRCGRTRATGAEEEAEGEREREAVSRAGGAGGHALRLQRAGDVGRGASSAHQRTW